MYWRLTRTLAVVATLSLLAPTPGRAADVVTLAGTIQSVDTNRGTLVVEDVGPWVAGQPAPVTPRTVVLTPSTGIFEARRAKDSDSGFDGDYKTTAITRASLVEGVFVSVECTPAGTVCRAVELTVVRTDSGA